MLVQVVLFSLKRSDLMNVILYHSNPLKFGGIDTFDYNFCNKLKDKINITFLYKNGNLETIDRLKKLGIKVQQYSESQKYICDVCICASAWNGYPDTVIAKTGKYIQMIHADYEKAVDVGFHYKKWFKTTEHVAVGKHVAAVFKKLYPYEKVTTIYNILNYKKETKPILKLISATRLSREKGYDRMYLFAQQLKQYNIKFRWIVFTDLNLYDQKPFDMEEFVYMKPSYDFFDYIAEADYGIQLSDTEGYCYFINECLQYGTPVISTNFPSSKESIVDGINGYLIDMNLSNVDIDKIVNKIPKNFKYSEKGKIDDWLKILDKKGKKEKIKVIALIDYLDKRPELINNNKFKDNKLGYSMIHKNNIFEINDIDRYEYLFENGFIKKVSDISEIKNYSQVS